MSSASVCSICLVYSRHHYGQLKSGWYTRGMKNEILEAIEAFDGKHTQPLAHVSEHMPSKEDIEYLLGMIVDSVPARVPGTGILKAWLELGLKLEDADSMKMIQVLMSHDGWEARLHLLQSLEYMHIDMDIVDELEVCLMEWIEDDSTLVRAWSFWGLGLVGRLFEDKAEHLKPIIEEGLEDEAGSVRARTKRALALIS